ncbi:MAG: aldose 1-epimerase family protein [Clostridia bacterium]|nr:aldose 1-epimerase family protein [Clostridia bacterium]
MSISKNNRICISNQTLSAEIDCRGAQLRSLKKDGCELLWQGDSRFWTETAPVLFPICGGLKDDRYFLDGKEYTLEKHGFACGLDFEGEKLSESCARFVLVSNEKTLKKYPYNFVFTVTFTLSDSVLETEYSVENKNDREMYFSVGAHEGYACKEGIEACEVIFNRTESFETCLLDGGILSRLKQKILPDGKVLPLKESYFETDALIFENVNSDEVTLFNRESGRRITVGFDGFENLLIWTIPGAEYVCIEPWSGFPDYSDTDGDFTKKNAIQRLAARGSMTKVHTVTV